MPPPPDTDPSTARGPVDLPASCRTVLAAFVEAGPSRKVDIAARLGRGRGTVIRAVDRLVTEGWLVHLGDAVYAAA